MTRDERKRIMETSYRESPANHPSFFEEALLPTGIFTGATYLAFVAGKAQPEVATIAAAAVCAGVLLWRILQWDEHGRPVSFTEHTRYLDDDAPEPIRPFVTSSDANRITVGKWTFTEAEWGRIGKVLATGRVSRASLAALETDEGEPLFTNITNAYPGIRAEFQRLQWIDEDNETTDVARRWYQERGTPLSAQVPGDNHQR